MRIRTLLLAALVAAPALAQSDPALAATADQFRGDLTTVTALLATAALFHDATGAYPATPYGLLGSTEARQTGLRETSLSSITVTVNGDRLGIGFVPLPVDPYTSDDEMVTVSIALDEDGLYTAQYQITRRADPDVGGRTLPYATAGRYRVDRGYGTACVDVATVRERLAAGTYASTPGTLGPSPLTVRVHPPGDDTSTLYEETRR